MAIPLKMLLVSLAVFAGGCLHAEQSLVLKPDGSGHFSATYAVPAATLRQMGTDSEARFDAERIRREFTDQAVPGVTLLDVQMKETNAGQAMGMKIGFEELKDLADTEFFEESTLSLERSESGSYRFTQRAAIARQPTRTPDDLSLMKGFRFVLNLTVPGRILSTNADLVTDTKATWRFDLDEDPHAIERMDSMVYELEFMPDQPGLPEYRRQRMRLYPPAAPAASRTEAGA